MARRKRSDSRRRRVDDFSSLETKLGVPGMDKKMGLRFRVHRPILRDELEAMYYADGISSNIVDVLPEEMLRKGVSVTSNEAPDLGKSMARAFRRLDLLTALDEGLKWARLYGGAGVLLGVDDGQDPSKPINYRAVRSFGWVNVLDRYQLQVDRVDRNPTSRTFGKPYTYRITGDGVSGSKQGMRVHASRVIPFLGVKINERIADRFDVEGGRGWGASVLQRAYTPLLNYLSTQDNIATMIQEYNQAIFQIKDLMTLLDSDEGKGLVEDRLRTMQLSRSVVNALLLEEGESFTTQQLNLRGLSENVEGFMLHLAAVTRTPVTKLFGRAPAGLNATGESDETNWHENVASAQENLLQRPIEKLCRLIMLAADGPTNGELPENWAATFPPVKELSEVEKAALRKTTAETDSIEIGNGVISPDEVRESRYGGAEYSTETTISSDETMGGGFGSEPDPSDVDVDDPPPGGIGGDEVPQLISLIEKVVEGKIPTAAALELAKLSYPHLAPRLPAMFATVTPANEAPTQPTETDDEVGEGTVIETRLPTTGEKPMSLKSVGEQLNVNPAKIRRMIKRGELSTVWKIGRDFLVLLSEVEAAGKYDPPIAEEAPNGTGQ